MEYYDRKNERVKNILKYLVIAIILAGFIFSMYYFSDRILFSPNEPTLKMVSGTEYISSEEGQIIVRLADYQGNSIEGADCVASVLYPDKSYFFIDRIMYSTTVPGNYYTSFTTPSTSGVYEEHISCIIRDGDSFRTIKVSSSFHVSEGLNTVLEISRSQREQYLDIVGRINTINLSYNELNERIDGLNDSIQNQFYLFYESFGAATQAMADVLRAAGGNRTFYLPPQQNGSGESNNSQNNASNSSG